MMEAVFEGNGLTIGRIVTPPLDNNVYLITCATTGASLIIDAASNPNAIATMADGTEVTAVATTHGHWDHHGAIPEVTERLGVPFMLHPADEQIAGKLADVPLDEGPLSIGNVEARIVHTPGHTPGSVCIVLDGAVITGDTLFPGGPGATRFDHSSFDTIIESISSNLFTLRDDTVVLPGHGDSTTIGTERPQLPAWIERGW
ncbi:MAG: MBL fold metallo-hydrolase [Acidimicrobiia bacterium]|nr:MAG: MBL fold metallo-hydrolase [Acidimicrobiia bacterium]